MYYWNNLYAGWGWFLWFGVFFLILSSFGNWGYTYRAHRRFEDGFMKNNALEILNERYARGDINHDEYLKVKSHVLSSKSQISNVGEKSGRKTNQVKSSALHPTF